MRRVTRRRSAVLNLDSLVDIVSNNVGILVILAAFMALIVLVNPNAQQTVPEEQTPTEIPTRRLQVPWSHPTNRQTVYFALQHNRLVTLDLREFYTQLAGQQPNPQREPVRFDLKNAALRFFPVTNHIYCLEFTLHAGGGESWLEAQRPASAWQTALRQYGPEEFVYFFWVSGDSFELFRELRQQLWQSNHEVGWRPVLPDKPLEVCTGFDGSRSFQPQ